VLDVKAAARLPDRLGFSRNRRPAVARRVRVGEVEVIGHVLRISDVAYGHETSPVPVGVPDGIHTVHAYQWDRPQGVINVCVVVAFRPPRWSVARRLAIRNEARPDLTAGLIVDHAEVRVGGFTHVTLPAGLGDGYYPVFGVFNFGLLAQAVVLDFQVWRLRNVVLLPGMAFDEYALVVPADPESRKE
jgi:hypothetical protein